MAKSIRIKFTYERIKDGISEDRLSCLNSMRRYFTEMPELEDILINLSKTVREDYDYNSFYNLANIVFNEMYIGNGYADKLKVFTDKVDLEKYSNELNLIFSQLNKYNNHSSYSDILNENISKRDLEYLLDMQKLMCENVKENENPHSL